MKTTCNWQRWRYCQWLFRCSERRTIRPAQTMTKSSLSVGGHTEFSVKGDGIADDSAVLQQAINKVRETTNQGILFVPAGRYRLTKTIYIWPGIRLIGFGTVRPTFVLAANTLGFQQGPAYMMFFAGGGPSRERRLQRMRNPGTFLFRHQQYRH